MGYNLPDGCGLRDIDEAAAGRYGVAAGRTPELYCLTCENYHDYCNCVAAGETPQWVERTPERY
jgi:hypothetical protein